MSYVIDLGVQVMLWIHTFLVYLGTRYCGPLTPNFRSDVQFCVTNV